GRIWGNPSGAGTVFAAKVLNSSTYNASQAIGRQSGFTGGAYGNIRVLNLTITPKSATKLRVTAGSKYVLISPCRDEAIYIRHTLDSVINQTIRPAKWTIVDDGSTDETPRILRDYQGRYDWIQVITLSNRGHRLVGRGVIEAFYAGYQSIE